MTFHKKDTLKDYGHSFQIKVITSLLIDIHFLHQIYDILKPEYFESESLQFIVKIIKKYFKQRNQAPTKDIFKIEFQDVSEDVLITMLLQNLKQIYDSIGSTDLDAIKDEFLVFCRNKELARAIETSIDYLEQGDYDKILPLIEEASKAGMNDEIGYEYVKEVRNRYTTTVRNTVPTPWAVLNGLMDGGLAAGELGVIVSPAGKGKSWILANLGCEGLRRGLNVSHYTLELEDAYTGFRYDSLLTGIPVKDLKFNVDKIEKKITEYENKLLIKHYYTKGVTIQGLSAHIDKTIALGKKPDLLIVDYADLIKGDSGKGTKQELRHEIGNTYLELRGLAGKYSVPTYTASQTNRQGVKSDYIEEDVISEDYSKIMTADFVFSIQRKTSDKLNKTVRGFVIKNRFGPDGINLPGKLDANTGHTEFFAEDTVDGRETNNIIKKEDQMERKVLANKFQDFKMKKEAGLQKFGKKE